MYEDEPDFLLEDLYEDRYTIQGDWDVEDDPYAYDDEPDYYDDPMPDRCEADISPYAICNTPLALNGACPNEHRHLQESDITDFYDNSDNSDNITV